MIKKFCSVFIFLCMIHNQNALAHGGGHGPVNEQQAITIASKVAAQFVNQDPGLGFGTLKSSWKQISPSEKRIHVKGKGYYIVSLTNKTEAKTLFVLMSVSGEIYDANFTGKFQGLK